MNKQTYKEISMNIVYAMTRNVYEWIIPSLKSLKEHEPKAKVYILCEDDHIEGLPMQCEFINVSGQQYFPEWGANYHNSFTYINLLKVCYPELLKVNKVIHLDIDTIVCDSLEGLWKTDITGKWVAAVPEYKGRYKPFGDTYYNMGAALLNLAQMRKDGASAKMAEYLNTVPQPYADQDAWHYFGLPDKFTPADVRYNESTVTGMTDKPAIVHYCGYTHWYNNPALPRAGYQLKYLR